MPYGLPYWPGSSTIRYNVPNSLLNLPANYWTGGGNANAGATGAYTAANTPMPLTKPISYEAPQKRTLQDQIGSFPDIESLTNMINGLNLAAQTKANQARTPGNAANEAQRDATIHAWGSGELAPDQVYALRQQAANWGVGTGNIYGANTNANALIKYLGGSQALKKAASDMLSQQEASNPAAPIFDPSTLLITPLDREKLRIAEENARLEAERTAALQAEASARQMAAFNATNWGNTGGGYGRRTATPSYGSNWHKSNPWQYRFPAFRRIISDWEITTRTVDLDWAWIIHRSS